MVASSLVLAPVVLGLFGDGSLSERLLATSVLLWLTRVAAFGLLALALYYRWRLLHERAVAWLCTCAVMCACYNCPHVLLSVTSPDSVAERAVAGRPALMLMTGVLITLLLASRRARGPWRLRPLQVGAAAGVTASALQAVWDRWQPDGVASVLTPFGPVPIGVTIVVLVVACVSWLPETPAWLRLCGAVVALCGAGLMVLASFGVDATVWHTEAWLVIDTVCCATLFYLAVRVLVATQVEHAAYLDEMQAHLEEVAYRAADAEVVLRADQEMLHELRSSVAAIASASHLLREEHGYLKPDRVERLRESLGREIERVERLLRPDSSSNARVIDVGDVIGPVVDTAVAAGLNVSWDASHDEVYGQADRIAEVVQTLLANAERHAPGAPVSVTTERRAPGMVELHVRDSGPGVPAEVREDLFGRGVHSSASPGQGIGLYVANRLLAEAGGALKLVEERKDRTGAEFVVTLPAPQPGDLVVRVPAPRRP